MKGVSLIEVVIASSVAAVAGVLLVSMLVQNNGLFYQQSARIEEGLSINDVSSIIVSDIKAAQAVDSSSDLDTLVLKIPSLDPGGNVINQTFDYVTFAADSLTPQILKKRLTPGTGSVRGAENRVLSTKLSKINFYYFDANSNVVAPSFASKVNFVINVASKISGQSQESSASSEVSLRND